VLSVIAGLAVLGVGVAAGWLIGWDVPPAQLAGPAAGGTAPVVTRLFDDARSVSLTVSLGPERRFQSPRSGRVTASSCVVGAEFVSGGSAVAIDGSPVVSLATAMPLWRDLPQGTRGEDAAALGWELQRLGVLAEPSGVVDAALISAFNTVASGVGVAAADLSSYSISVELTGWLPAASVAVEGCPVAVGDLVVTGQALASFPRALVGAGLTVLPSGLAAGERVLMIDGQSAPVGDDGRISDPAVLAAMADWPSVRASLAAPEGMGGLMGKLVLTAPLTVGVVPAAAVVARPDGGACLVGDGQPVAAVIVGSELGQSFVVFDGVSPGQVDVAPPRDLTC
jgi:hypothetical protein